MEKNDGETSLYGLFRPLTHKKVFIFLIIIGLIVYFDMLFNGFAWDDQDLIVTNNAIRSISNIPLFFIGNIHMVMHSIGRFYRPVTISGFALNYALFGLVPFVYHADQLILQIINACLVFIFFNHFLKKKAAFMLSLIFLVHPINVEAIDNISSIQEPQFFLFGMLALLYVMRPRSKNDLKSIVILSILLLLSFLSKETGFLFWLMILMYTYIFEKSKLKVSAIAGMLSLGVYLSMRYFAQAYFDHPITRNEISIIFTTAPKIYYQYITNFFYPLHLGIYQIWLVTSIHSLDFIFPLFFDIFFTSALIMCGVWIYKKRTKMFKIYMFFLIWFLVGISFHLQLWEFDMTYADRWFYFPIIGLIGVIGVIADSIQIKRNSLKVLCITFFCLIIISLSIRTMIRNLDWQNDYTLMSHDALISQNPLLYASVINTLFVQGNYQQAYVDLQGLKKFDKTGILTEMYTARIDEARGENEKALSLYQKLFHTEYGDLSYEETALILLTGNHNYTIAQKVLQNGLRQYPTDTTMWRFLAYTDLKLDDKQGATKAIQQYKTGMGLR